MKPRAGRWSHMHLNMAIWQSTCSSFYSGWQLCRVSHPDKVRRWEATRAGWLHCKIDLFFPVITSHKPSMSSLLLSMWWTKRQSMSAGCPYSLACHFRVVCVQVMTIYTHTHIWNICSSPSVLQLLSGELEQTLQKTHFSPLNFKDKYCTFQKDFNGKQSCFLLEGLIKWNLYLAAALVILLETCSPRSSSSRSDWRCPPSTAHAWTRTEPSCVRPYWASVVKGINA